MRQVVVLGLAMLVACSSSSGLVNPIDLGGNDSNETVTDSGTDPGTDPGAVELPADVPPDLVPDSVDVRSDVCVPQCAGKACGDDGCGGDCGPCKDGKVCDAGSCSCALKHHKDCCGDAICWFDSCGNQGAQDVPCPNGCEAKTSSTDAVCKGCTAKCTGKECGTDGCGGECGKCATPACEGLSWTPGRTCTEAGLCTGDVIPQDCSSGTPCKVDLCDPEKGCSSTANADGTPCAAASCVGPVWTQAMTCVAGACTGGGGTQQCEDGNPCTDDTCLTETGCVFTPNSAGCDDSDPCTTGDHCAEGKCIGAGSLDCDDHNACSADSCKEGVGCLHEPTGEGQPCGPGVCSAVDFSWTSPGTCLSGSCVGSGQISHCDDGLSCTTDSCDPVLGCGNGIQAGKCLISGACHAEGETNGSCKECKPFLSQTEWSYVDLKACDDKSPCTKNDLCKQGGTGDADCAGTVYSCDDSLACTSDSCDGNGGCVNALQAGLCLIAGVCWAEGQTSTTNVCESCDTTKSTSAWSSVADGTSCGAGTCTGLSFQSAKSCQAGQCAGGGGTQNCDDSLACTVDSCSAATGCLHALQAGKCLIAGDCRSEGDANPANACEVCATSKALNAWSPKADASICEPAACNALEFTAAKTCQSSLCTGGGGKESCDDGKTCTTDTCDATKGCAHALKAGNCLIDGTCYAEGAVNPANACEACAASKSTSAWSVSADGTTCAAATCTGMVWTPKGTCAAGTCKAGTGGGSCDDGKACTTDICDPANGCNSKIQDGYCVIDNACYGQGQANPANACQVCDATKNALAWTSAADGSTCQASSCLGLQWIAAKTCQAGACSGGGARRTATTARPARPTRAPGPPGARTRSRPVPA